MESPDIWIIGSGNVAWHLAHALKRSGRTIAGIYSPTEKHSRSLGGELHIPVLSGLSDIPDRGIVILAVPDDAVPVLASSFDLHQALLVHTSGSVDMDVLKSGSKHVGVLYPLQSLSKGRPVEMKDIPFLLEASGNYEYQILENLAKSISQNIHRANSVERRKYHLAAVIVNNFSNYLITAASDFLVSEGLDFKVLQPLLHETVKKAIELGPERAQTGPARRGDHQTMDSHLSMISDPVLRELYRLISEQISKRYSSRK